MFGIFSSSVRKGPEKRLPDKSRTSRTPVAAPSIPVKVFRANFRVFREGLESSSDETWPNNKFSLMSSSTRNGSEERTVGGDPSKKFKYARTISRLPSSPISSGSAVKPFSKMINSFRLVRRPISVGRTPVNTFAPTLSVALIRKPKAVRLFCQNKQVNNTFRIRWLT